MTLRAIRKSLMETLRKERDLSEIRMEMEYVDEFDRVISTSRIDQLRTYEEDGQVFLSIGPADFNLMDFLASISLLNDDYEVILVPFTPYGPYSLLKTEVYTDVLGDRVCKICVKD